MAYTYIPETKDTQATDVVTGLQNSNILDLYNKLLQYNTDPNKVSRKETEMLASQFGPDMMAEGRNTFKKSASSGKKVFASLGGVLDGVLFDLIPDKAYSDESTADYANWGRFAGNIGSLLIPGTGVLEGIGLAKTVLNGVRGAKALKVASTAEKLLEGEKSANILRRLTTTFGKNKAVINTLRDAGNMDDAIRMANGTSKEKNTIRSVYNIFQKSEKELKALNDAGKTSKTVENINKASKDLIENGIFAKGAEATMDKSLNFLDLLKNPGNVSNELFKAKAVDNVITSTKFYSALLNTLARGSMAPGQLINTLSGKNTGWDPFTQALMQQQMSQQMPTQ